jgi:hypothetical protein
MATRKKQWVYSPPKPKKPKVPEHVKQEVTQRATELIESILKPQYIKAPPENPEFNYLIDIFSKWYRNYFYFCGTYASPSPHAMSPTFETRFARMEYGANGRYTLSYFRHTGQWWELYSDLTLEGSFQHICDMAHFHP